MTIKSDLKSWLEDTKAGRFVTIDGRVVFLGGPGAGAGGGGASGGVASGSVGGSGVRGTHTISDLENMGIARAGSHYDFYDLADIGVGSYTMQQLAGARLGEHIDEYIGGNKVTAVLTGRGPQDYVVRFEGAGYIKQFYPEE